MSYMENEFFNQLKSIYSKRNLSEAWHAEEQKLRIIVPKVVEAIGFNYEIERPLAVGGAGVVSIVRDKNLGLQRALKISRPSPGKVKLLAKLLEAEAEKLLRLSHRNLIQVYAHGMVPGEELAPRDAGTSDGETEEYPYYVMEFVDGAKDSDEYLAESGRTLDDFIRIVEGAIAAVEYLHEQGTIHMDLKPGNVLVTPKGVPVVSDLGFAKQLRVEDKNNTLIGGTEGFMHPEAREFVINVLTDPNRLRGQAPRSALHRRWDLYSLGKTFLALIEVMDKKHSKEFTPYARRYLRLLSCRLLDGRNTEAECALGLSRSSFGEIKYLSIVETRMDLQKLIGSYNLETRLPELNPFSQETIQTATLATTPFTRRVKEVVSHPAVSRLGKCKQLGLLNLVYPTATHTRLEHSLGTFSVLCRFIHALHNDTLNPLFKQIMQEEDLRAAMLAALFHDIGQYPLAHDLEEADHRFFSHEELGTAILRDNSALKKAVERPESEGGWGVPIQRIRDILAANPSTIDGTLKDRILHSLIDGPFDADKIDYLKRDSRNLGLPYGTVIDFDQLLRCLTIIYRDDSGSTYGVIGIHEKGKVVAESIAFARYAMFGQVYWHHTNRAIKAMIHRMVWEIVHQSESRQQLREKFRKFLLPDDATSSAGQTAFVLSTQNQEALSTGSSQIDAADFGVLTWLSERGGETGKELLRLLSERRLFKRIFVLSKEGATDKKIWETVASFYREHGKNWQAKLTFQDVFQRRLVEYVESPPKHEPAPLSQFITPDAKNAFLVEGRRKYKNERTKSLILVDIPPEKKGSESALEYLVEEDRRKLKTDELKTESLERSIVWHTLQQSFLESIGKLRIFCHPDHSDFLASFVARKGFESCLSAAIAETEKELEKASKK
ncbi:MAG: HD domain-containing protein [Verrucomicrobia bacterium]|nr:HD domain-containing protein [Verrucomicrobiota bacterium]